MKIKRILIANRGEIAVRIMKTARIMKIETVAIKTAVEPNAMYLSSADIVYDNTEDISDIPVFLDIDKLIETVFEGSHDELSGLDRDSPWACGWMWSRVRVR